MSTTDCWFSNVCPPCQRKRPPAGKIHVTISLEQTNTCTQLPTAVKQENSNLIWKRGVSDLYPCSAWQAQVRRACRDFNHHLLFYFYLLTITRIIACDITDILLFLYCFIHWYSRNKCFACFIVMLKRNYFEDVCVCVCVCV